MESKIGGKQSVTTCRFLKSVRRRGSDLFASAKFGSNPASRRKPLGLLLIRRTFEFPTMRHARCVRSRRDAAVCVQSPLKRLESIAGIKEAFMSNQSNLKGSQNASAALEQTPIARIPSGSPPAPSPEEIARRAYDLYVRNGCREGTSQQDWLEAERELLHEYQSEAGKPAGRPEISPTTRAGNPPSGNPEAGTAANFKGGRSSTRGGMASAQKGGFNTNV
ncbi:MAG TPA: DUF2934 domain-containing protein [Planctomycetota bacterium]|nr:DUF2934 domain-containing protein [Planctomycetota bacterium]